MSLNPLPLKIRKKKITLSSEFLGTKNYLEKNRLNTVCVSAKCPNIEECFKKPTATFMVMGEVCTRNCGFCSVKGGKPEQLDTDEPFRIAEAVKFMKLKHTVITSVTRDDLPDRGIAHFISIIQQIRKGSPEVIIEVLTPEFPLDEPLLHDLATVDNPDIFNHNIETVPRLYKTARSSADYRRSLDLLQRVKELNPTIYTKSGLILGLGEEIDEVKKTLRDLRQAKVDIITIGQYLKPSEKSLDIAKTYTDDEFLELEEFGKEIGFSYVYSGYFVRSSYNAESLYQDLMARKTQ